MGAGCHTHHHGGCCFGCSVGCSDCYDDCECECFESSSKKKLIAWILGVTIIIVAFVIFVIWLVLRPTKPSFVLKDVTVKQFNLSLPDNLLSTTIQATVSTHNSNGRVGAYYDRVDVFAAYQSQQITLPSSIPSFYQGHDDVNVWSPYLLGGSVPVEPYLCDSLQQDKTAGMLLLYVKVDAKIRWKVGTWTSRHYHLEVTCPAYFAFRNTSVDGAPELQFQRMSPCSASV